MGIFIDHFERGPQPGRYFAPEHLGNIQVSTEYFFGARMPHALFLKVYHFCHHLPCKYYWQEGCVSKQRRYRQERYSR